MCISLYSDAYTMSFALPCQITHKCTLDAQGFQIGQAQLDFYWVADVIE